MFGRPSDTLSGPTPLDRALAAARPGILGLIGFGSVTSILSLVPPLYMLNVFDRVMSSRNVTTLAMLTAIAFFLVLIGAIVERMRASVSLRIGAWADERVSPALLASVQDVALRSGRRIEMQALRDLDSFREFWTGPGLQTLVRAAWSPLFVVVLFLLHPVFGYVTIIGLLVILVLTVANDRATRVPLGKASAASRKASTWMSATIRNIEVMHAMGMRPAFRRLWQRDHKEALFWQNTSSDKAAVYVVASNFFQSALGLGVLGIGVYLAIQGEISAGAAFVSRILFGQAVGPLTNLISQMKGYTTSRIAYENLQALFRSAVDDSERVVLPIPDGALSMHGVMIEMPETRQIILRNINLSIEPGDVVAMVGPSGSGKSTLARAMVGVLQPAMGEIRLDGADLKHWQVDQLGRYLGYVPQDVELIPGTIAQNIQRFNPRNDEAMIAAAKFVGAHDMILRLASGYNTPIDIDGRGLSGGQRQRIALARAAYGQPAVVVLDEPNSNLDASGEQALLQAIKRFKAQGTTVVIVTHKAQILAVVDKIIYVNAGGISHFGPRDEVMAQITGSKLPPAAAPAALGSK